ncbi:sedoheptulose 7-phosphate cyclase [Kitasatospora sp. NPDC058032]|uniref:sedoheptulose 7-phosphate cyclase n=1 Tax=Kitasatospora sp. NPDC058032 TaxID=3346307 RepID=UPI0036DBE201
MPHQLTSSPFDTDLSRPPASTWTVECEKPVRYQVAVTPGVLDFDNTALARAGAPEGADTSRRFLVVDAAVGRLYGDRIREYLDFHRITGHLCVLEATEENKTSDAVFRIFDELDAFGIDRRREPVIGIGGGVLLDVVGLASSLYRRKTPYVRVPTTLVGLIDAGIGAKTGVNFGRHKNRLGTYEPPAVALLDRSFIATQEDRQISNGLAEILKIGLIKDRRLFDLLEEHGATLLAERLQGRSGESEAAAREVLRRAVQGMLEELQPNLWEQTLERVVDYGHSFSPSIEMAALPELLHGEAVAVDMALTTLVAARRGLVTPADRDRIIGVLRTLRLPVWHRFCEPGLLSEALAETVRHRDGAQRLPLPVGIGSAVFVNDLTDEELAGAAEELAVLGTAATGGREGEAAR